MWQRFSLLPLTSHSTGPTSLGCVVLLCCVEVVLSPSSPFSHLHAMQFSVWSQKKLSTFPISFCIFHSFLRKPTTKKCIISILCYHQQPRVSLRYSIFLFCAGILGADSISGCHGHQLADDSSARTDPRWNSRHLPSPSVCIIITLQFYVILILCLYLVFDPLFLNCDECLLQWNWEKKTCIAIFGVWLINNY